ncbi:hypothetical protein ACFYUY_01580 [Kitasatospora sp. NPDC004745]|uniref:hypothetical protein n=1 Tax=Kitasatospora sp. NPDC004745 TaxID=3364019 RepID=UPI0036BCCC84
MRPFTPPPEGICGHCEQTLSIRKDGCLKRHTIPYDPEGSILYSNCPGSDRAPAIRLDMTFARWLHAHAARRDYRDNPVTFLAQWMFRPCSRTRKTPADVTWSSPEELHLVLHGAEDPCGWQCRYIEQAAAGFAAYDDARRAS